MSLSGKLEDVSILDVMQFIHLGRRSGNLFVWSNDRQAAIVFNAGRISRVWVPGMNRYSDLLRTHGSVSASDIEGALEMQKREQQPRSIQAILLEAGALGLTTLEAVVTTHVMRTIAEVSAWKRGLFEFTQEARLVVELEHELDAIPDVAINAEEVLLEVARIADEMADQKEAAQAAPPELEDTLITAADLVLSDAEKQQMALTLSLVDAEREIGRLMKLYVATYQLHASLNPDDVKNAIKDIAVNLLGAERFVLIIREEGGAGNEVLIAEGVPTTHPLFGAARYLGGDPAVDGALSDGTVRVERGEQSMRAVVPLKVHGSIVGALVILKMLDHKPTLSEDDKELLQLIASHAATALFAARTYTKANRKMRTLEQLVQLIRADNDTAAYVRGEQVA